MTEKKESLGPKPTILQMETLKKLNKEGVTVHWVSGIRGPSSASIVYPGDFNQRESMRTDTLSKFVIWGWLTAVGDPAWEWRNMEYCITEKGRKVVNLGVTRK